MSDPLSDYIARKSMKREFRLKHIHEVVGIRYHPAKESWNKLDDLFSDASQAAKKIRDGESPALALSAFSHANGLSLDESKKLLDESNLLEISELEKLKKDYIKKMKIARKVKAKEIKKKARQKFKLRIIYKHKI